MASSMIATKKKRCRKQDCKPDKTREYIYYAVTTRKNYLEMCGKYIIFYAPGFTVDLPVF